MTCGSLWPVVVFCQSMTRGSFPGPCNLVLQGLCVVGVISDMWLIVSCWCIFSIHDTWFFSWSVKSCVTRSWCSWPNLWRVAHCELLVYFLNPWHGAYFMVCEILCYKFLVLSCVRRSWCSWPYLWLVAHCDLLVYFPNPLPVHYFMVYLVKYMTYGSLWTCFIIVQKYDE